MRYQNFKTEFFCLGGHRQPLTLTVESDIAKSCQSLLFGKYVRCKREKSSIVSDITKQTRVLGRFLAKMGKPPA